MSSPRPLARLLGLVSAAACLSSISAAQAVYVSSWLFPDVYEIAGPAVGPCNTPHAPFVGSGGTGTWSGITPPPCPGWVGLGAMGPFDGDIASDRIRDHLWVTDGHVVIAYVSPYQLVPPVGTAVGGWQPGSSGLGTLTGLGFDAPGGLLWATDGRLAAAYSVVPPPSCLAFAPAPAIGPFALPPLSAGALYTDIDWDSSTSSLLLCASDGTIVSLLASGAPGPFGTFSATSSTCALPLGAPLGIAVDAAAPPGSGTYYVSDGFQLAYQVPPGVPAPPTFYTTQSCTLINEFGVGTRGLAFSARAIRYGPYSVGGFLPHITSTGQTTTPGPSFALRFPLMRAGERTFVAWSTSAACPFLPLAGQSLALGLPVSLFAVASPPAGIVQAPIPAGMPVPGSVFFQGFAVDPVVLSVKHTEALAVSFALP